MSSEDPDDLEPGSGLVSQQAAAEQYATAFLSKVIRLRGVKIDREQYLSQELRTLGLSDAQIGQAIASTPVQASVALRDLDELALFLGVMMGVRGAATSLGSFAQNMAQGTQRTAAAAAGRATVAARDLLRRGRERLG